VLWWRSVFSLNLHGMYKVSLKKMVFAQLLRKFPALSNPIIRCRTDSVVVQWLTLLRSIRKVPGSYFGPETGYPGWFLSWFFSVPSGKCRDSA
jgi:hypothetical protein